MFHVYKAEIRSYFIVIFFIILLTLTESYWLFVFYDEKWHIFMLLTAKQIDEAG